MTIVWVAKRETPILGMKSTELKILDGNLVLMDESQVSIWSTNVNLTTSNSVVAALGDNGNLVLRDESEPRTSEVFWQSFDNPTDTLLPDPNGSQCIIRWNRTKWYWTSGRWNGRFFVSVPKMSLYNIYNHIYVDNFNESYYTYCLNNRSIKSRYVMDVSRQIKLTLWYQEKWVLFWFQPRQQCDVYAYCGSFGTCNQNSSKFYYCLPGFKQMSKNDWNLKDYSGGCVREIILNCTNDRKDKFLANSLVRLPSNSQRVMAGSASECESICLSNCSCTAYSYEYSACLVWNGELMDLQEATENNFQKIKKSKGRLIGAVVGSVAAVMVLLIIVMIYIRRKHISRATKEVEGSLVAFRYKDDLQIATKNSSAKLGGDNESGIGVPFCSWESIIAATEFFKYVQLCVRLYDYYENLLYYDTCGISKIIYDTFVTWYVKHVILRLDWNMRRDIEIDQRSTRNYILLLVHRGALVIFYPTRSGLDWILVLIVIDYERSLRSDFVHKGDQRPVVKLDFEMTFVTYVNVSRFGYNYMILSCESFNDMNSILIKIWESIIAATENFSDVNKLGRGGFGPVYKGMFHGGQEIAVKRLSSCSSQGINEFQNEIVLIAKLQHRNLVRLLGYCMKENEKILLYEYMANKSLDAFIFDKKLCMLLDGKKRFDIILGIARGVLYLHQDSRLRIIHRDLKTSNILLDEEMNPKISDFGLARIVEGKRIEASTNKVIGTYGYMSPEYASDGLFSIKSDVFSFGVVVLEIITGKRNTGFYQSTEDLNLLGYVSS
ncbi:G-type lectin S-receptor-like serine threonine-kinase At4g03230 isoform X1 [Olea europaea subsp. europaea]|uniref:Receptor-like serine/threonine-protein kinase n=1 Tax=Olea europaea subsp. europaea TaxID=158383 RepID=A0A8S0S0J6_OLEEU|nr:G-type lectin S-receptor-like serine threonine-kinase At4g03230 isoform X1 [Olea europaea subsp. europaea]